MAEPCAHFACSRANLLPAEAVLSCAPSLGKLLVQLMLGLLLRVPPRAWPIAIICTAAQFFPHSIWGAPLGMLLPVFLLALGPGSSFARLQNILPTCLWFCFPMHVVGWASARHRHWHERKASYLLADICTHCDLCTAHALQTRSNSELSIVKLISKTNTLMQVLLGYDKAMLCPTWYIVSHHQQPSCHMRDVTSQ